MKFKVKGKKILVLLLAATLLAVNIKSFADEAESRRFSILSISGNEAFLTRGANEVKATAGMPVGQGNTIRTGAKTKMYLETDDSKTIRLDSSSSAEVTKSTSKLLKITLKSGSIFFNVDKPLKEDEEMSFDAAQTSMSIRGTSGIIRITEEELILELIEGNVAWNLGSQTIAVSPGEKVTLKAIPGTNDYQLQGIENFTWEDLLLFDLETVLEQIESLDVSAIELTEPGFITAALEKVAGLQEEKSTNTSTGNPRIIKMDVPKTRTKRNRGRSAVQNSTAQTPVKTEPTTEETEESTTESTIESTAESTIESTEEMTTEPSTTEAPTESAATEAPTETSAESPTTEKESTTTAEESSKNPSSSEEDITSTNPSTETETSSGNYESPIPSDPNAANVLIAMP